MNTFHEFVERWIALLEEARRCPLGRAPFPPVVPPPPPSAPHAVLLSPHPDDECIMGTWALRLKREAGWRVTNVCVTLGSNPARRTPRHNELQNACRFLGIGCRLPKEGGLENINPRAKAANPTVWEAAVLTLAAVLREEKPTVLFVPHAGEANTTHQGVAELTADALRQGACPYPLWLIETEFWAPIPKPNCLVETPPHLLGDQITALTFHVGEVSRNPYHLSLPAWMSDNVRRGSELVGGQGGAAATFPFGVLYRLRRWTGVRWDESEVPRRIMSARDRPDQPLL
jgi:LmbE family N-acetylglucosaminyl deacetylase